METKVFGQAILFGALGLIGDDLLCLQKNANEKFSNAAFYAITKMEGVKGLVARLAH